MIRLLFTNVKEGEIVSWTKCLIIKKITKNFYSEKPLNCLFHAL